MGQTTRSVDVVFCIDGTGSMGPCINKVKDNAKRLYADIVSKLTDEGTTIESLRLKVITFRDYKDDGDNAMVESSFFEMPDDQSSFDAFLNDKVIATGGGDYPENGLEALYYAMMSDWVEGPKDRQVIVMFTDNDALALHERASCPNYPVDVMPKDITGLVDIWAGINKQETGCKLGDRLKRLIIFAPDGTIYSKLNESLDRTTFEPVDMKTGLEDIDFSAVVQAIVASVSAK